MLGGGDWEDEGGGGGGAINRVGLLPTKGSATFLFCLTARTETLTGNTQSVDHRLHPLSVPLHFTRIPLSILVLVHVV